ncbi:hypothetical protein KO529_15655 [Arenibacter algicola]|uniref:hypothetical protein n=1 Tax=Arenibacter algicola TaxID=616991 RepID=UPI001C07D70C|nr:hypothetical protein [Arenibacter algicola]MBU2906229.1 hypothetical protein [Arenibacter algicola]
MTNVISGKISPYKYLGAERLDYLNRKKYRAVIKNLERSAPESGEMQIDKV